VSDEINQKLASACIEFLAEDMDGRLIIHYLGDGFRRLIPTSGQPDLYEKALDFIKEQLDLHKRNRNTKLTFRYHYLLRYYIDNKPKGEQPSIPQIMQIKYSLDERDYLIHQMYVSGSSKFVRRRRIRNRFIVPVVYVAVGAVAFLIDLILLGIAFLTLAIIWMLLYPFYSKRLHMRHFRNNIKEHYDRRVNEEVTLAVAADGIFTSGRDGESKINYDAVDSIVELSDHFIVRLISAASLILPKDRTRGDDLKVMVKSIADNAKVEIVDARDWNWQ